MKRSAGLLLYKYGCGEPLVLLVHPGGPFWAKKDLGSWSIPKGEYEAGEDPLQASIREFAEETGAEVNGTFHPLGEVAQPNRKIVTAWAVEGDFDTGALKSNICEIEWPPRSGKILHIPEVDRAEWFSFEEARRKINPAQLPLIERLQRLLSAACS
jgi:predicted NUDIX family NTP pyrophosphohydrolase